ncbi:hypothetical protein M501DRAFT_988178 [Patellaria atrata CBS 101060]|uniref:7alpha-cephem-methoxylase P8 chain related protein n=1 Tax=Patellaria atrata CBS 101060 TaxID=1346257 RepID=A0A9P4SG49_9PEZI|nr:hypothetical protein M501DRAFT_988178 [Patellaria atrata CBS 101060]
MATATLHPTPAHQPAQTLSTTSTCASTSSKATSHIPHGPVTATLTFYSPPPDGSSPYNYVETPPPGLPQRNYTSDDQQVLINDIRAHEDAFTLDAHSFAALKNTPSTLHDEDFDDEDKIKQIYFPEIERLLLARLPGAKRVLLFDHTIRRATGGAKRAPVTRVHIDQTPASARERVRLHCPEEAEQLLEDRVRIVNVWRPINGPVESFPLAFADGSSVRDEELVGIEHRYPNRTGETAGVRFSNEQRWWYWSAMEDDEVVLLKCFDGDEDVGPVGRVPHSAFVDPRTGEGARGRESIEVRALVFG